MATVGRVDDSFSENIESNGGTENGAGDCVGRAHLIAPSLSAIVVATVLQSVEGCG